jgi:hypothetical protein
MDALFQSGVVELETIVESKLSVARMNEKETFEAPAIRH